MLSLGCILERVAQNTSSHSVLYISGPLLPLHFHSLCLLAGWAKCPTSSSFLPGFVCVLPFSAEFYSFLGSQEGQSTTCCLTLEGALTTICSWRVKIDFESWTDYQQNGGVLSLESTGNL